MGIALLARELVTMPHSGLSNSTLDLAEGLSALGHRVHVIAEAADGAALSRGIAVHDVSGGQPLPWAVAAHGVLAKLHAGGELDVACAPLWGANGVIAVHDPRFPTLVSCMTSATTIAEIDPEWGSTPEAREAIALERACVRGARHLQGLTRAALDKTIADYGGSPLTTRVVPHGVPDSGPAPAAPASGGPVHLLFVGRIDPRKGVDVLLDALAVLTGDDVDFALTIAGPDGPAAYRAELEERLAGPLGARVRFAGEVSDPRLRELFAEADVVCQPSRYESQGIVLAEAMMSARAIVTAAGGGIPEVVEDGVSALVAGPGDVASLAAALRAAIADEPLRRRLAAAGRERFLERFELGAASRATAELMAEAAEAHAATPADGAPALLTRALGDRLAAREAELERWSAWAYDLLRERDEWRERAEAADGRLWQLTGSRSWRLTGPLRGAVRVARGRRNGDGPR